ncbi:glutamine--fructose-6-phosphate aminotransferase [isomerizing] 1-like [Lactuca sativa]|uniref:glutamine--fructose-6-phosphate aminotransferase [isomerizing] 1-like n=1 Tax=Lactuca sativa TaxID=4236 RepID=UPI0022AFF549|nr:glutamine--fructose-6-phosphate aminotransferase [isomerizing] 1-like [Lactuca sativa]
MNWLLANVVVHFFLEFVEQQNKGTSYNDLKFISTNGHPKELFLSSDPHALVEHMKKVLVIEDSEVVHIKDGGVTILKFEQGKGKDVENISRPASVQRSLSILEMEVEQINKGKYEHYMQKEIHEQPKYLTATMRGRLILSGSSKWKSVLLGGLKDHLKTIRRGRRIVFIGCGTSYNATFAARPILEELSGIPVTMEIARNGALCVGITNTVGSAIARNTHCGVHMNVGSEIGVTSTKAYTSQIVVMAMVALAIGADTISSKPRREAIKKALYICQAGPVVAEAMFVNCEEIPDYPKYRDPVSCFNKDEEKKMGTIVKEDFCGPDRYNTMGFDIMEGKKKYKLPTVSFIIFKSLKVDDESE